ncbi:hypothetical protein VHEMI08759 [[Torrubiella] hemipterigena]|uniref:Extracellular protein n=1 Tax=[Torrubiella] hemipterigena TaxID=1531966 RepID=A0A0A1TP44_9HYPO|nr:hypothetical protein VHEMI08759 [[Torrubiella] hemipterigena]
MQFIALLALAASASASASGLAVRAEQAGVPCSQEGQWNCMTRSFQRCASGLWSREQPTAKGMICAPAGYTMDVRLEHDGSVNNGGGVHGGPVNPPPRTGTNRGDSRGDGRMNDDTFLSGADANRAGWAVAGVAAALAVAGAL